MGCHLLFSSILESFLKTSDPVIDGLSFRSGGQSALLRDDKQGLLGSGASRIKELPRQESGVRIGYWHKTMDHCELCER